MRRLLSRLALSALLLFSVAGAQDIGTLIQALRKAARLEVRGEVTSSVFFPPREQPTRMLKMLPRVAFVPSLLRRNFDVSSNGTVQIAGRSAAFFALTPKNANAGRWSIWLDAEWKLPLAFEERDSVGGVVRRAEFTSVQEPPRRRLHVPAETVPDASFRGAVQAALPGLQLPRGFVPVGYKQTNRGREIVLSDGLNVLALVIAERNVRRGNGVAARRVGDRFVWLVGNLPPEQLRAALAGITDVKLSALGTFVPQADSKN